MNQEALPRIVFLPGLGADERMFQPQRRVRAHVELARWIKPLERESLAEYARRLAETIQTQPPFFLAGASIGGMIALEMAHQIRPKAVILIASCRSCRDISRFHRLGRIFFRLMPAWVHKWIDLHVPAAMRTLGASNPDHRHLIRQMIRDTPAGFIKWGLCEALRWPGPGDLAMPVYHIHGDCDRTIPCPANGVNHVISGGGHLINLTHADEVNAFIERVCGQSV